MKHRIFLVGTLLSMSCAQAFAGSNPMAVSLKGTIAPGSCVYDSREKSMDLGDIDVALLEENEYTNWERTEYTFSVHCDSPTRVMFRTIDNDPSSVSAAAPSHMGLGKTADGKNIGYWKLHLHAAVVNEKHAYATHTEDNGITWSSPYRMGTYFQPGSPQFAIGFREAATGTTGPDFLTSMTGAFGVDISVMPSKELGIDNEESIKGSATIEMLYL